MATVEEIARRVEQADAARSSRRSAAARCVGELALLRADAAAKLADIERELGDVLAEFSDVIGVDELAEFTEVPATDLQQWLNNRKTTRTRRKRTPATPTESDSGRAPSAVKTTSSAGTTAGQPGVATSRPKVEPPIHTPDPMASPPQTGQLTPARVATA